ncbi:MAG: hypothetical protein ACRDNW_11170, partial [Trebonia sp.]
PAPTPSPGHGQQAVKAHPATATTMAPGGLASKTGAIAGGSVGEMKWTVSVVPPGKKSPVPGDACYAITIDVGSGITGTCRDLPRSLGSGLGAGKPAAFTQWLDDGATATTVGEAAADVTYFLVNFADGQQLKLIPVTVSGHRYIAWIAPPSKRIDSVVAHLGGPYSDSGQTATAVPFQRPGGPPLFGLWQQAGQAAPPRDFAVIGRGAAGGGLSWSVTAYEGPWGTCFVIDSGTATCVPRGKLDTTQPIASGGRQAEPVIGSAAPGVASLRFTLSNGAAMTVKPVRVGNEDLFAFATFNGVPPTAWTAYDASGRRIGAGSATPSRALPADAYGR